MTNKDDNKRVIQLPEPPVGYQWSDEMRRVGEGEQFYQVQYRKVEAWHTEWSSDGKYYALEKLPEKVKTFIFWRERAGGGREEIRGVTSYDVDDCKVSIMVKGGKGFHHYPLVNIESYWFEEER